jgi:prophage regulatory protein
MALSRFIDMRTLRQQVPFSKTEIYRRINAGTFPRPVTIGPRRVAFLETEVREWMEKCIKSRDAGSQERREEALRAAKSAPSKKKRG